MIVTEELIRLLSFCEAHKYKSMVYKGSIELSKALKISAYNLRFLENITELDTPYDNLCFYDEGIHIASSIGVIKHGDKRISTFKKLKKDYVTDIEKTLSKAGICFLSAKGWEINDHYFIHEQEGYEIDSWSGEKIDLGMFKREADTMSFWVHGLMQKKFKPFVSDKACSICKHKKGCKNYKKLSSVQMDDLFAEMI